MKRSLPFLAVLALFGQILFAQQQVVLTPIKDNTLYQTADGSLSDGSGDYLFVGRVGSSGGGAIRRTLLRFDIPGTIPPSSTITSVTLTMNMSKSNAGPQTISLQKLTADWGEGTSNANANEGSGAPSSTNDATWIHRFFPATSWTKAGGDFSSVVTASIQVNSVGTCSWGSTSQMVTDVQGWLTNPSSNFGWILIGNEATASTAMRFDSRQNGTVANRPKLTVTYKITSAVSQTSAVATETALEQNFPNPFNPTTIIRYSLSRESRVRLSIFDLLGREVQTLVDRTQNPGSYSAVFDATKLPSGVYCYVLNDGVRTMVKQMALLK
jgi:hypothetical protein